jgi:hypothetical protein
MTAALDETKETPGPLSAAERSDPEGFLPRSFKLCGFESAISVPLVFMLAAPAAR